MRALSETAITNQVGLFCLRANTETWCSAKSFTLTQTLAITSLTGRPLESLEMVRPLVAGTLLGWRPSLQETRSYARSKAHVLRSPMWGPVELGRFTES